MKTQWFLIVFLLISFCGKGQEKNEKIRWSGDLELTWVDFKADPDRQSAYSANTNSGISYNWSYSTDVGKPNLEHEVFSNFYPNRSWVKSEHEDDDNLLEHERLHFDISELYARKLRRMLREYEPGRNIRHDLKQIYDQIGKQRRGMQQKFDKETNHSGNHEAEQRWRKFVAEELDKLRDYAL